MNSCRIHPEDNILINLKNHLYCGVCHDVVLDYIVFRTDEDRSV